MQLTQIQKLVGQIELVSGLHIGGSSTEMHIGGMQESQGDLLVPWLFGRFTEGASVAKTASLGSISRRAAPYRRCAEIKSTRRSRR